jgi:hypothetical protein
MSEYQYYEFQAIDQPLDEQSQRDLRGISSRATITATSFTNTYSWGNLRGDPAQMLARWFDAFLHVANWGTRWLAFRLPRGVLSLEQLAPYEVEVFVSQDEGDYSCLHFHLQPEGGGGDWLDGEELLGSLLPLREAVGTGDLRCLYLAWLVDAQQGELDEEDEEPPVPPGLNNLDAPHRAFVDLMGVDADLLASAAEASAPLQPTDLTPATTLTWLAAMDSTAKDSWLLQVIEGNGARVRWELRKRLRDDLTQPAPARHPPRTVGELLQRAQVRTAERKKRQEQARAERRERQAAQRAVARERRLDSLVGRESELWRQVEELIATRKPKSYDEAVEFVTDLRDLAERAGERAAWEAHFSALRAAHHRKSTLIRRLDKITPPRTNAERSR